eukprot:1160220-Pelagomonas_calceolata.AAC.8
MLRASANLLANSLYRATASSCSLRASFASQASSNGVPVEVCLCDPPLFQCVGAMNARRRLFVGGSHILARAMALQDTHPYAVHTGAQ